MTFFLRQVQKKCLEKSMPLYAVFTDFSKAINTVSREELWQVLRKFAYPEQFINLTASLYNGRQAYVTCGNAKSKDFDLSTGVNQGCVLAPTLFSLFLAAMLEVAFRSTAKRVYMHTHTTQRRLHCKAKTKTECPCTGKALC